MNLVMLVRASAMILSGVAMTLTGKFFWDALQLPWGSPYKIRTLFVTGGLEVVLGGYVWHIFDKVINSEPWEWHSSPLLLVGSFLLTMGLFRFLERRKEKREKVMA